MKKLSLRLWPSTSRKQASACWPSGTPGGPGANSQDRAWRQASLGTSRVLRRSRGPMVRLALAGTRAKLQDPIYQTYIQPKILSGAIPEQCNVPWNCSNWVRLTQALPWRSKGSHMCPFWVRSQTQGPEPQVKIRAPKGLCTDPVETSGRQGQFNSNLTRVREG